MTSSNPKWRPPDTGSSITNTEATAPGGQSAAGDGDGHPLKIKVSYGSDVHDVYVPSDSTFGDLKKLIAKETGMEPQMQKLLFRGKQKDDSDLLQMAGVKDNSKLVLMEERREKKMKSQEMDEQPTQMSRGGEAVALVREEVDKLSKQVFALQAVVNAGNKIQDKDIVCLTEMLMRQLLKLDNIDAEGEGKVQRKQEVRRVQSFVDTVDILKARNSNPFFDSSNAVSLASQRERFDSGAANLNASTSTPLSTTVTQEWERFD